MPRRLVPIVHVAKNDQYLGYILIADEIKEDAAECIRGLKAEGVNRVIMLTGDRKETADYVASQIGLTEVHSELLPGDKVDEVEKIIASKSSKGRLVFVGDGINDAAGPGKGGYRNRHGRPGKRRSH